eukprot:6180791-Pleurochrysis_carterae.AAC.1
MDGWMCGWMDVLPSVRSSICPSVCVRARMRACVRVWTCACVRARARVRLHVHSPTPAFEAAYIVLSLCEQMEETEQVAELVQAVTSCWPRAPKTAVACASEWEDAHVELCERAQAAMATLHADTESVRKRHAFEARLFELQCNRYAVQPLRSGRMILPPVAPGDAGSHTARPSTAPSPDLAGGTEGQGRFATARASRKNGNQAESKNSNGSKSARAPDESREGEVPLSREEVEAIRLLEATAKPLGADGFMVGERALASPRGGPWAYRPVSGGRSTQNGNGEPTKVPTAPGFKLSRSIWGPRANFSYSRSFYDEEETRSAIFKRDWALARTNDRLEKLIVRRSTMLSPEDAIKMTTKVLWSHHRLIYSLFDFYSAFGPTANTSTVQVNYSAFHTAHHTCALKAVIGCG